MRISWHTELGCVVLSSWKDETCVATVRLTTGDAARLMSVLADGLAAAATGDASETSTRSA
ncbi:MAG: hypothetical protein JWN88_1384 [Frankiales bacterium]|jgi:hypothetical protein|nr:hypothetical protein [Frankiales bacterium]